MELTRSQCIDIWSPWRRALIIKLLGKNISFKILSERLPELWHLKNGCELTDLDDNFFVVRFYSKEEYMYALEKGPWVIMGHYLTVMKWKPYFNPSKATINKTLVWIRLPNLPVELFDPLLLMDVGNMVGRAVKVDNSTLTANRGKYARVYVELDLDRTLTPMVKVNGLEVILQRIEYEGLHAVCFQCVKFGHKEEECADRRDKDKMDLPVEAAVQPLTITAPSSEKPFGPWLLPVSHQRRRPGSVLPPAGGQQGQTYLPNGQTPSSGGRQVVSGKDSVDMAGKGQYNKQMNLMKGGKGYLTAGSRYSVLEEELALPEALLISRYSKPGSSRPFRAHLKPP